MDALRKSVLKPKQGARQAASKTFAQSNSHEQLFKVSVLPWTVISFYEQRLTGFVGDHATDYDSISILEGNEG